MQADTYTITLCMLHIHTGAGSTSDKSRQTHPRRYFECGRHRLCAPGNARVAQALGSHHHRWKLEDPY